MATPTDRRSRRDALPTKSQAGQPLIGRLRNLPSPSRARGGGDAGTRKGFLDGLDSTPQRNSYREMLRASGQQALLRVQNSDPASPTPKAMPPPPSQPPSLGGLGSTGPAPSLLLLDHLGAPGECSTRSAASAPCLPASAFGLPSAGFTPSNAGTPMVAAWPDMSPEAGRRQIPAWPDMSPTPSPEAAGAQFWPEPRNTFFMERLAESPSADLMAIAMPQAKEMSLDGEQIAAHLRAAAPAVYED